MRSPASRSQKKDSLGNPIPNEYIGSMDDTPKPTCVDAKEAEGCWKDIKTVECSITLHKDKGCRLPKGSYTEKQGVCSPPF